MMKMQKLKRKYMEMTYLKQMTIKKKRYFSVVTTFFDVFNIKKFDEKSKEILKFIFPYRVRFLKQYYLQFNEKFRILNESSFFSESSISDSVTKISKYMKYLDGVLEILKFCIEMKFFEANNYDLSKIEIAISNLKDFIRCINQKDKNIFIYEKININHIENFIEQIKNLENSSIVEVNGKQAIETLKILEENLKKIALDEFSKQTNEICQETQIETYKKEKFSILSCSNNTTRLNVQLIIQNSLQLIDCLFSILCEQYDLLQPFNNTEIDFEKSDMNQADFLELEGISSKENFLFSLCYIEKASIHNDNKKIHENKKYKNNFFCNMRNLSNTIEVFIDHFKFQKLKLLKMNTKTSASSKIVISNDIPVEIAELETILNKYDELLSNIYKHITNKYNKFYREFYPVEMIIYFINSIDTDDEETQKSEQNIIKFFVDLSSDINRIIKDFQLRDENC